MRSLKLAAAALAVTVAVPAMAQESDIDALIDATATPGGAIDAANAQAASGDLTGAAATLERALLLHPKSQDVRLAYVGMLCRLDDKQRARIEATRLPAGMVPGNCSALGTADLPKSDSGTGWRAQLSAGLAYAQDAGGAIALRYDIPGVTYAHHDGVEFVAAANIAGRSSIGGGAFFYGSLSAQTHNDVSGPKYNYQVGDIAAGLGIRTGSVELSAGGVLSDSIVSGDRFLTEIGGEASASLYFAGDNRITLHGAAIHQNYLSSPLPLVSRDGSRYDLSLAVSGGTQHSFSYGIGGAVERKTADTNYLAYHGWRLFAAVRAPLGSSGAYASLGGTARHIDYYNDPFTRDYVENRYFGRAALGVPLIGALSAEAAATYTVRGYNANSFLKDYHSIGGELRLIYNFGK